jgi:hypothetical protein
LGGGAELPDEEVGRVVGEAEWRQHKLEPYTSEAGTRWGERGRLVVFIGRPLASGSTKHLNANRWQRWRVFETEGGRVVVEYEIRSQWRGERSWLRIEVFDGLGAVPDKPGFDAEEAPTVWLPKCVRVEAEQALRLRVATRRTRRRNARPQMQRLATG